jgi:hypothetical protein
MDQPQKGEYPSCLRMRDSRFRGNDITEGKYSTQEKEPASLWQALNTMFMRSVDLLLQAAQADKLQYSKGKHGLSLQADKPAASNAE